MNERVKLREEVKRISLGKIEEWEETKTGKELKNAVFGKSKENETVRVQEINIRKD